MDVLACPIDHHSLNLEVTVETNDGLVDRGILKCSKCDRKFPIENGIPKLRSDKELTLPEQWWELANPTVLGNFMRGIDPHNQPIHCRIRDEVVKAGNSVLDVGCGTCIGYPLYEEVGVYYVGVDLTYRLLMDSKQYNVVPIVQGDARELPFKNESFDSVFCKDFLVHLPPDAYKLVLKEMWRVTRKLVMIGFFGHAVDIKTDFSHKISEPGTYGPVYWSYYPKTAITRIFNNLPRFNNLRTEKVGFEGGYRIDYRSLYIAEKKRAKPRRNIVIEN